jgi:spermidine synthase
MYQNLSYTSLINSSIITRVLGVVNQRNVAAAGTVLGAVLLILIFFRRISCRAAVSFTVATTGMSSMIGGVLLMSAFQVFYGNLFHHMGMLLALLMAGIGTGSYLAAAKIVRRNSDRTVMLSIEFSMAILLLAQAISLNFLQQHPHENVSMIPILSGIFLIGLLTGVTYPVASRLYRDACHTVGVSEVPISTKGAGFVYAADLFGGCFGGVLGALVLIPALGIKGSFILMGILKMATALTFACSWGFLQKRAIR